MARTRQKITEDNFFKIWLYIRRAYTEDRLLKSENSEKRVDAKMGFDALFDMEQQDKDSAHTALQVWVATYLSSEAWGRCLNTIKQARFRQSKKLKTLKLPADVYYTLAYYAEKQNLTLSEAVANCIQKCDG